jgi:hypothetical protein
MKNALKMLPAAIFILCSHISAHRLPYLRSFLPHYLLHVITQFCLGLPFSDKKFFCGIRNKTKQTAVPSEFRLYLRIQFQTISRKRKTLGIPFWTIFGQEKPRNSVPNYFRKRKNLGIPFQPFLKRKNLGIPFRTIFGKEKTSELRSEPIFGKENPQKSVPNQFWEQKTLEKRPLLLAAS